MNKNIPEPHYIVASLNNGPARKPKYHQTAEDAIEEAERLALAHRDDSFQVYKSHRFVRARLVDVYDNSKAVKVMKTCACGKPSGVFDQCDDCIPF